MTIRDDASVVRTSGVDGRVLASARRAARRRRCSPRGGVRADGLARRPSYRSSCRSLVCGHRHGRRRYGSKALEILLVGDAFLWRPAPGAHHVARPVTGADGYRQRRARCVRRGFMQRARDARAPSSRRSPPRGESACGSSAPGRGRQGRRRLYVRPLAPSSSSAAARRLSHPRGVGAQSTKHGLRQKRTRRATLALVSIMEPQPGAQARRPPLPAQLDAVAELAASKPREPCAVGADRSRSLVLRASLPSAGRSSRRLRRARRSPAALPVLRAAACSTRGALRFRQRKHPRIRYFFDQSVGCIVRPDVAAPRAPSTACRPPHPTYGLEKRRVTRFGSFHSRDVAFCSSLVVLRISAAGDAEYASSHGCCPICAGSGYSLSSQ